MLDKLATNVVVITSIANFKCCVIVKALHIGDSGRMHGIMFCDG